MSVNYQGYAQRNLSDEFLAKNRNNMIIRPHHQGNLLISRDACIARRLKAQTEELTDLMKGDVSTYVYRKGLSICLNCHEEL